ncbi:YecA family protein [Neobacillus sp. NPDC058068]|uniref:YecA family protein n=1 Tax=Neobacillus sp. NPDC058068 TaxID=3346325 RepID=UPI0036DA790E
MEKINRNDLCPCGSGEKYSKCCGANKAISINLIIESELDELQKRILHFAFFHFGNEINEDFEDLSEMIDFDMEQEREFYELIHAIWFSLFEELDDEETIIEKFIAAEAGKIKRPKLKQILQTWSNARVIAGKVISVDNNQLTVEDGFTSEQLNAIVGSVNVTIEEGSFFIGMIVPYEQNYLFFPSPFDLPVLKPEHAFSFIEDSSLDADYDSPQEYLKDFFLEVLSELPIIGGMLEIEEMEWSKPIYKEVADIFKAKLESEVPPPIVDTGIILWFNFCEKKQKRIQNPNLYAAAVHYLLSTIAPLGETRTQKELARLYGAAANAVASIVLEMETELSAEIAELKGLVFGGEESPAMPPFETASIIEFPIGGSSGVDKAGKQKSKPELALIEKKGKKGAKKGQED